MNNIMASPSPQSPKHPRRKILVVTGDCPSHPYACAKLATILARRHDVTVAGPNGAALSRLQSEAGRYNESTTNKSKIECVSIGDVSTLVHCNVRTVRHPHDYSPAKIIYDTLFDRDYVPYGIAKDFEQLMDDQEGTYEELKRIIPEYDLVYAIHTAAGTVCDAVESLRREGVGNEPPVVLFSSLPYNSGFLHKDGWRTPRSIVALPHVATYSSPKKAFEGSSFFPVGLVRYLVQLFWMWLDSYHAERAWRIAGRRTDERRARRGLPPVYDAMRYYWMNYPLLSVGGMPPFIAEGERISDNATVVGSIRSTETSSSLGRLEDWFDRARVSKIVYASFGTGTQLSVEEATNLARLALSLEKKEHRLLLSLSRGLQERLRHVFDQVLGSKPSKTGDGWFEYMQGEFRVDDDVPQESLLLSKSQGGRVEVDLFVSHMGFSGYAEAVRGGVPFVAYPSGCDQWYNAERAVEAGVAVRARRRMEGLAATVREALDDEALREKSRVLASRAASFDSEGIVLGMVDEVCDGESSETASTCSTGSVGSTS